MRITPLVSIITPSFNQSAYLENTIRSVLAQGYAPFEYIIVDGASTDGSLEIIKRYTDRLAWWVSEADSGQAEAINKGLERASGEIIAWLNSDDLYLPGAISNAVAALEANPSLGMVFGDAITIDPNGRPLNPLVFGDWGLPELMRFRIICQPAVFIRREVLEKAGSLDTSYHFMLDHHLWLRIARLAPVQHIENGQHHARYWAAARHHPKAKNVAQPEDFARETLRLLDWISTQPDLDPLFSKDQDKIMAGAFRLSARYTLDAGMPRQALRLYLQALLAWPGFALAHWHRMVYALLSLIGLSGILDRMRERSSAGQSERLCAELRRQPAIEDWPGINLEP